jgi:hypothetical protein
MGRKKFGRKIREMKKGNEKYIWSIETHKPISFVFREREISGTLTTHGGI